MKNSVVNLPGLNGLRAIAAVAVVLSHITLGLGAFGLDPGIFGRDKDGSPIGLLLAGFGVSIFFTLSGFLITYLLLKEKEVSTINVKKFYIRRALRIWPLYYLFLIICVAVTAVTKNSGGNIGSIWFYIFLAANVPFITGQIIPMVAHYWSLGVEEQFYLVWPWAAKIDNKKLLIYSIVACCGLIGLKVAARIFDLNVGSIRVYDVIHVTRFHCMLIGAVSAILFYQERKWFIRLCTNKTIQVIAWIIILLVAINKFHTFSIIDNEIISVVTVCLILGQINGRPFIINLNKPVFNFLGKISYGLYVIHPLVIFLFGKMLSNVADIGLAKYFLVYTSITAGTIILAFVSYTYYEKRFLKLKASFAVIKSSDTPQPVLSDSVENRMELQVEPVESIIVK